MELNVFLDRMMDQCRRTNCVECRMKKAGLCVQYSLENFAKTDRRKLEAMAMESEKTVYIVRGKSGMTLQSNGWLVSSDPRPKQYKMITPAKKKADLLSEIKRFDGPFCVVDADGKVVYTAVVKK